MFDLLDQYPDILNFNQFKDSLGIGKNKAYELLQNNEIKHFRIGTNYKIPKTALINYISNLCK